jgi:hypothetical protein
MSDKEWYDKLTPDYVSQKALDNLPEYSLSLPTGAVAGTVWKRDIRWGRPGSPLWVICEYVDHPTDPNLLKVEHRRPVIK